MKDTSKGHVIGEHLLMTEAEIAYVKKMKSEMTARAAKLDEDLEAFGFPKCDASAMMGRTYVSLRLAGVSPETIRRALAALEQLFSEVLPERPK